MFLSFFSADGYLLRKYEEEVDNIFFSLLHHTRPKPDSPSFYSHFISPIFECKGVGTANKL